MGTNEDHGFGNALKACAFGTSGTNGSAVKLKETLGGSVCFSTRTYRFPRYLHQDVTLDTNQQHTSNNIKLLTTKLTNSNHTRPSKPRT